MKKTLKQRLGAGFLTLAMALSLLPANILPARAAWDAITGSISNVKVNASGQVTSGQITINNYTGGTGLYVVLASSTVTGFGSSDVSVLESSPNSAIGSGPINSYHGRFAPAVVYHLKSDKVPATGGVRSFDLMTDFDVIHAGALTVDNVKNQANGMGGPIPAGTPITYDVVINMGNLFADIGTFTLEDIPTYTLSGSASPAAGGTVKITAGDGSGNNATSSTSVPTINVEEQAVSNNFPAYSLEATPASGYKFLGWTVTNGTGTLANNASATTTYTPPAGTSETAGAVTAYFAKKNPAELTANPASVVRIADTTTGLGGATTATATLSNETITIKLSNSGDYNATIGAVTVDPGMTFGSCTENGTLVTPGTDTQTLSLYLDYSQYPAGGTYPVTVTYDDGTGTNKTLTINVTIQAIGDNSVITTDSLYWNVPANYSTSSAGTQTATVNVGSLYYGNDLIIYQGDISGLANDEFAASGNISTCGKPLSAFLQSHTGPSIANRSGLIADLKQYYTDWTTMPPATYALNNDWTDPTGSMTFTFQLPTGIPVGTYQGTINLKFYGGYTEMMGTPNGEVICAVPITIIVTPTQDPALSANDLVWDNVPSANKWTANSYTPAAKNLVLTNAGGGNTAALAFNPTSPAAWWHYTGTNPAGAVIGKANPTPTSVTYPVNIVSNGALAYTPTNRSIEQEVTITYGSNASGPLTVKFKVRVNMVGTVTFHPNYTSASDIIRNTSNADGKVVNVPTPSQTNYTFQGWYKTQNGANNLTAADKVDFTSVTPADGAEYWAGWKANSVDVKFDPQGGTFSSPNSGTSVITKQTNASNLIDPWPAATKANYHFKEWNTKSDGTGDAKTSSSTFTTATTLYAQWVPIYTVTFDGNGGGWTSPTATTKTATTDVNKKVPSASIPANPGKTNYTFAGWYDTQAHANAGGNTGLINFSTQTFSNSTTVYAGWTAGSYTATITLKENGGSTNVSGATVALGSGSSAVSMPETGNTGVYTATSVSGSYNDVTIVVDGGTYTVTLGTPLSAAHDSESVNLYVVTLNTATTVSGSATPYGSATVSVGSNSYSADNSNSYSKTFHVPGSSTLKLASTTPAANYTNAAGNNWTVGSDPKATNDTVTISAATTVTAKFTPHGKLKFTPAPISGSVKQGYLLTTIVHALGDGSGNGSLENVGPAELTNIKYKVEMNGGPTWNPATQLQIVGMPTSLPKDGAAGDVSAVAVKLNPGLTHNAQKYKAKLTIWDDTDSSVDKLEVNIEIEVKEASSAAASPNFTWDTYTQRINHNNALTTQVVKVELDDIASIQSVVYSGTTLTIAAGDYTAGTVQTPSGDTPYINVTLTNAGLIKLGNAIKPSSSGAITFTAMDTTGLAKTANVTMTLEDTMPALGSASFSNVTNGKWPLGGTTPVLTVKDNKTTPQTVTDASLVTYEWTLNGAVQTGTGWNAATLPNTYTPAIGDTLTVKVTGKGAPWTAKPSSGDYYKNSVSVTATYTVSVPEVTVTRAIDGTAYTVTTSPAVTAGKTALGNGVTLTTSTSDANKYVFEGWDITSGTGYFGTSGTDTTAITPTIYFRPTSAVTVRAKWKTIATLTYKNGSSTSGPNADSDGDGVNDKYVDKLKNVGARDTTISDIVLGDTDSGVTKAKFTLVKPTGNGLNAAKNGGESGEFTITPNAGTAAGIYHLTITTTYSKDGTTTATVVQDLYYTVPEPKYTITLNAATGGSISGNYKGSTTTTGTYGAAGANKTILVSKNDSVALTANPAGGYKFVEWGVNPAVASGATSDKLSNAISNASNAYGGVTKNAAISATFAPVTDLSKTDNASGNTTTANLNYSGTPTVYGGKVSNLGAKAATVKFELQDQRFNGASTSGKLNLTVTGAANPASVTINAGSNPGTTPTDQTLSVTAVNGLAVGVYTANLVITEITAVPNPATTTAGTTIPYTMSGLKSWTVPITFTVTGSDVNVQLKLDGAWKDAETVTLMESTSGALVTTTVNTTTHNYKASGVDATKTYKILVNGNNTGKTIAGNATSATLVNLWTLTTAVDPADLSMGNVGVSGGTQITVTGASAGTTATGYVDGNNVTLTATPASGKMFEKWTDEKPNLSWSGNQDTTNPKTIAMTAARSVKAHFKDVPAAIVYVNVYYHDNKNQAPVSSGSDAVLTTVPWQKSSTAYTVANLTPAISGYTFLGWATTPTGNVAYHGGDSAGVLNADLNLYAKWVKNPTTWPTVASGVYGEQYDWNLATTGITAYGITAAGDLPLGLRLDATNKKITGKPAETGYFPITLTFGDGTTTWNKDYTIFIDKATPALSGISFTNAANDTKTDDLKITGLAKAPLATNGTTWTAPKDYQYTDYVKAGATGTSTAAAVAAGALKVVEYEGSATTSSTEIQFGSDTTKSGKVKFTPSTTKTNTTGTTHQPNQTYADIYKEVTVPCTFNMGGKTYGIDVTPDAVPENPASPGNAVVNVGGTLPTTPWAFAVKNEGNQVAHVTYELQGTDATSFTLTPSYSHQSFNGSTGKDNDEIAVDATTNNAFTVGLASSVTNTTAQVYVAQVKVTNWSVDASGNKTAQDTVIIPLRFEVKDVPFDGTVQIDLNNVTGNAQTKHQEPRGGSVVLRSGTTDVTAAWTADATSISADYASGVYKATGLRTGTTYQVVVNGHVITGVTVTSAATTATVNLYQVKLAASNLPTTPTDVKAAVEALQVGPGYLAAGESGSVSTPGVYAASGGTNYEFNATTKWQQQYKGDTAATATSATASYTYTMPTGANAKPVTLTAPYKEQDKNTVKIIYHENPNATAATNDVLWEQTVDKSKAVNISSTVPTRNGYAFEGWTENPANTGIAADYLFTNASKKQVPAAKLGANLDLYAKWTKLSPTFPTSVGNTYYSAHYSDSAALTWPSGVTGSSVTYTIVAVGSTSLPDGLDIDPNTGVITGRPYKVGTFKFKVKATLVSDATTSWDSGELQIVVDKATPRLANALGENATTGLGYNKADYYAAVVADIYKNSTDGWEDGKVIISATDLYYKGSGATLDQTSAANGGLLAPESGTFSSGNNSVKLTWTPGDTTTGYPLRDGAGNKWGDIFKKAETTVGVTPGSDIYQLKVEPTVIKFKVVKDSGAYQVLDGSTYKAIGSSTADNITLTNDGNMPIHVTWALTGTDAAKFSGPATPGSRTSLATKGADTTITAVPDYDDAVGTYTAQVKVTAYDAATGGNEKSTGYVTLVLEVVEADTFDFQVDTWLNSFGADTTSPVAGTIAKGNVTSVKLEASSSDTHTVTTTTTAGEYAFTGLSASASYKVFVNGVELPGVLVNKTTASPLRVDLYQLTLAVGANGTNTNLGANPAGSTGGYYLPGERISVTPGDAASGYNFKSWDETVEGGTGVTDTTNAAYSTANPLNYVMGSKAVKLTANYAEVGKQFKVVLNGNGGTINYFAGPPLQTHLNVLHGGTVNGSDYLVNDGAVFGLDMAVDPATTGKYNVTNPGSSFVGWATSSTATTGGYSFTASQAEADADGTSDDTITLFAVWSRDNDLRLDPVTIQGKYKHPITDKTAVATGGVGAYTYTNASDPFPLLGVTIANETVSGKNGVKVSGTPDEVGTKTSTVTVTDDDGNTASAPFTVVIDKADVTPAAPLPTTIDVANGTANIAGAITGKLNADVPMDGDGTGETGINGAWALASGETAPTTPGTHSVKVTFTPANKAGATDHTLKDGDHYNPYTTYVTVVIGGKKITDADLDINGALEPILHQSLKINVSDVPTGAGTRTLDVDGAVSTEPTYTVGSTTGDVKVAGVKWTKNGVTVTSANNTAVTGADDYTLYITLEIEDGSTWRFDSTQFQNSTIAGRHAETSVNDTMAVLWVSFPKQVTVIDVNTGVPLDGATSNAVSVPPVHANEYVIEGEPSWYESGTTTKVGTGVPFDKDKVYDLVVTVKLKDGVEFSEAIKNVAQNASMNDLDGDNTDTDDTARLNSKEPQASYDAAGSTADKKFVRCETAYNATNRTITIRYRAIKPEEQKMVGIRAVGDPGAYYAQTGASSEHFKLTAGSTAGNTGSKDGVKFQFAGLTVYPIYLQADGTTAVGGTPLNSSEYTIQVVSSGSTTTGGAEIPADGFKDQYTPSGATADRTDVNTFDGKGLLITYNSDATIYTNAAFPIRVQQLRADSIAVNGTDKTLPTLEYEPGDTFTATTSALKADVTFNADVAALKNTVEGRAYAAYNASAADSGTYFFEYGESDAPTFVAHASGDPKALGTNALLTELQPGVTAMTSAMGGKTLYMTYVDVNHNVVRVPLGVIKMGSQFTVEIDDTNGNEAEYADELVGKPKNPDGSDVSDPNAYTYQWQYWVPGSDGKDPTDPTANGTWANLTTPDNKNQIHHPGKNEVGEHIRVVAKDRATGTSQVSPAKKIEPRSLNFTVKPKNKVPDSNSYNIHRYVADDFILTPVEKTWTGSAFVDAVPEFGGVAAGDTVTLTPAGSWNNSGTTASPIAVDVRPSYRHGDGWSQPLGSAEGDKITWPAVHENINVRVNSINGYTLGGASLTTTSLNGTANVAVYRLRDQDEMPDCGTIVSVVVDDENDHDHEYGDKLTAKPTDPSGADEDPDGNWDYQWEKWVPGPDGKDPTDPTANGTWVPMTGPGSKGKEHIPGGEEVDEYIHVVITDPTDTKRESSPMKIEPRSLNFIVEPQNRAHTDDDDATNTHTYTAADFMLTTVKKDFTDADGDGVPDMDATNKMATFTDAAKAYGGPRPGDVVTLAPVATAGNWNAPTNDPLKRPSYLKKDAASIAAGTASGEVDSEIIWPQVFAGNKDKAGADENAGQVADYVLGGASLKNSAGKDVYRLVPQDEQLHRGKITGGASGSVMHVNVDFQNYPAIGGGIPNYPDAEAAGTDGTGPVAVTDKRETRPGEILDHANDTHTALGAGYPGNEYIAMWYKATQNASNVWAGDFDPLNPGTAVNAGNAVGSRPTGKTFNGDPITVVVKVTPRKGYKYDLLKADNSNIKTATKFHFHFSSDVTVDLPVATSGPAGVMKDPTNETYYMWYTFTTLKILPFVSDGLDLGLTLDDFIYYANTETAAGNDHHYDVNTAGDNNAIPGGKQNVGFTYDLAGIRTAINKGGAGTALKRIDGSTVTLTDANYGSVWRLKAGAWSGDPNMKLLDDNKADGSTYKGKTFKDTVYLPTTNNSGDSDDYDGKYVYIEVTVGSEKLVYGAPLGVKDGSVVNPEPLSVKELEAQSISETGTLELSYTAGDAFDASGVSGATVSFNMGTADYTGATYAAAADAEGKKYYFQKWDATNGFVALPNGATLTKDDNGKIVYICYTDVNNHVVRKALGALQIKDAPVEGKISKIAITYPEPVTSKAPTAKGKTLWTYDMLTDKDEVTVSETPVDTGDPRTQGSTWYTAGNTAPTSATDIKNLSVAANKLDATDTFAAGTYYMVEAKIDPKTVGGVTKEFDTTGVKVNINGIEVTVGDPATTAMGTRNDGTTPVAWAMAEYGKNDDGNVTHIIARYVARTADVQKIGELTIGYTAPEKDGKPADQKYYTDTNLVDVAGHDTDDPTKANTNQWYSDVTAATDFSNTTAMKFDGEAGGPDKYDYDSYYMVQSVFTPKKTGFAMDATTKILVDGKLEVTANGNVATVSGATAGLLSAKATVDGDNIVLQAIYKTEPEPDPEAPKKATDVFVTYRAPITDKAPDTAPNDWGNQEHVELTATSGNTAAWYTVSGKDDWTGGTASGATFAEGTWYRAESVITPKTTPTPGYEFLADNQPVRINGIGVIVGGDAKEIKDHNDNVLGYVKAVWTDDTKTAIKAMYIAKTADAVPDAVVKELTINYALPEKNGKPADHRNYTDTSVVTVTGHDATDPTKANTDQWYSDVTDASDFTNTTAMKFDGETGGPDLYDYDSYYMVQSTFVPETGYDVNATTTILVDGKLLVTADGNVVTVPGATTGLLSAKATVNGDNIILQAIYKTEPEPAETPKKDATDVFVTYRAPITDKVPDNAPSDWGNQTQVDLTVTGSDTAAWYPVSGKDDWTGGTAMTLGTGGDTFVVNTWYRAESVITPKGTPAPGYKFLADNQKVRINGIEVTVGGAVGEIKDSGDNVLGYVKAVWVDDTAKDAIKAMYIAKTQDNVLVTAVGISYTKPVSTNKAADYINYLDRKMVTVPDKTDTTAPTKWYEVSSDSAFTETAKPLEIGTDDYEDGKYYMVVNVIKAEGGYKLDATTKVVVDGELDVVADGTAVAPTTVGADGLQKAVAEVNSDGDIVIKTIYKVPETEKGKVGSITITYPEPKKDTEPKPNGKTLWGYQYLSNGVTVSENADGTTAFDKDTEGSKWYHMTALAGAPAKDDFNSTSKTDLTDVFGAEKYYMVEGVINHDSTHVFDDTVYVTINGILVTVDGDVEAKYDNEGNAIGWAMAVKDGDTIKARYIAKTEPADSTVIDRVQAEVVAPAVDAAISGSVTSVELAFFDNDLIATPNVSIGTATWTESDTFGSGYGAPAGATFQAGKYYQAQFEVSPKDTTYEFQNKTDDFVAFKVNGVVKGDDTWGVNDKVTPDEATRNGIKVMTQQKDGNPNKYVITVQFPLTGDKKEPIVIGNADEPKAKQPVDSANIFVEADKPYEIKNTADAYWQHWNGTAWVNTAPGEAFKAGDFYRAVMTVTMKDSQKNLFEFTKDTMGRVNTTDAVKVGDLPATAPAVSALKTSIIHNETAGEVTTVTLAKEFRVPRDKVVVHVGSAVPTAGAYGNGMDVKIYEVDDDGNKYELSDGGVKGQWYTYDGSAYTPVGSNAFEEGKTYYLMTTATAKNDYCLYDDVSGYQWRENGTGTIKAGSASSISDIRRTNGDVDSSRVAFEYTIPARNPISVIPGNATPPENGKPLDEKGWTSENFTVVDKVVWYEGEKKIGDLDSSEPVTNMTAKESTVYTAVITVKPKDGVQLDADGKLIYTFNGETCATGEYKKNDDGTYTLLHTFPQTSASSSSGGGGGGGGGASESPIVYYHLKDQGVTEDPTAEKVRKNSTPKKVPKVKATTGLKFLGWSEVDPSTLPAGKLPTLVDPTTFKITKDKWFYAVYEQGAEVDHLHYVIGFPNGTFAPDAKITRAEVATIIARSCLDGFVEGANYGNPGNYNDVTSHWAFSAIAYCAREGVFNGYEDGTFRPDRYITRQELATVVARLAGIQTSKGMPFNDKDQIASWAVNGVYTAYANGWVNGYEDNTFQPEREISRAETVKIFNGYLKRGVNAKGLEGLKEYVHSGVASNVTENGHDEYMTWPDVPKTHWAYHEIIEAANDHNYHWQDATKQTPPEAWEEVYIDEKWKYNDNKDDGADKRDENISAQKTFTVTYLVSNNGVTYDAITETVERFASPKPENMPVAVPNEGYRFAGWSSTDPSTGVITLEDPTASSVTADKWFYAVFEEDKPYQLPTYTVTYVIGELGSYDGATQEQVEMYQAPTVAVLPWPTATEGYHFAGWSETDPAIGGYTTVDPTANYITGDKTFYAVFEADTPYQLPVYTVTYVIGELGSYSGATQEQVEIYQAPSVSGLPKPTANEGYSFVGWSETDPANGDYSIVDPTANYVTGDKTFYAVYEAL